MQRVLQPLHLLLQRDALRVMAPGAVQRAALEEDGGANARPVLGREALQVQDAALLFGDLTAGAGAGMGSPHLMGFTGNDFIL